MTQTVAFLDNDLAWLRAHPTMPLYVAVSGGLDSVVLLHRLCAYQLPHNIRVIHVHHGLSQNADAWAQQVEHICQQLGLDYVCQRVSVDRHQASLEQAARIARYRAFTQQVQAGGCLLLGHHAGDQAETLLLRLLRGTGGKGLAGMPKQRLLASERQLLRPLLHLGKPDLLAYAQRHNLLWVEDESNQDIRFDRNRVRHQLMPILKQWVPDIDAKLAHTATRIATDYAMLRQLAEQQWRQWCHQDGSLGLAHLSNYANDDQFFWLRSYLDAHGIQLTWPQQQAFFSALLAPVDKHPLLCTANARLTRYQQRLYSLPPDFDAEYTEFVDGVCQRKVDRIRLYANGPEHYHLGPRPQSAQLLMPSGQHRGLKKWLNDRKIPLWWRDHLPYIYHQDRLVAIANLWLAPEYETLKIDWQPSSWLPWPGT